MKFNTLILGLAITLIAALTAGCGSGAETSRKDITANTRTAPEVQKVSLPEESPALIGKVKEIVGNEVTIFKGELPQKPGNQGQQTGDGSPDRSQTQARSRDNQGRPPQNRGMAMKFTEETETFLIPVGTPIVTMQRGANEAGQAGLADIKKDTILRIWKKDDTISLVQVMGGNISRNTGQGAGGNRQGSGAAAGAGGGIVIMPGMGGRPPAGGGGNR